MPSNSTKILLLITLVSGMLVSVSSNSWIGAWMGLEVNLMSFIPLMSNIKNMYNTEASLKYFIVQVLASATLLFMVVMKTVTEDLFTLTNVGTPYTPMIVCTPLLLKSGAAPFHWWFPGVMEGLSWENCGLLMTIQSAAPMMLMSYLIEANPFMLSIILASTVVGAIGGLNQTSMRKILTYSSINHTGWMLMALITGDNMWVMYFMTYSVLVLTVLSVIKLSSMSFINQTMMANSEAKLMKFMMFTSLLSLGGLPPFLGFLPKWFIIQAMTMNKLMPMATMMVITSLITLYYYLKITYSSFMILATEPKWSSQSHKNKTTKNISAMILSSISLTGATLCTIIASTN
uniref:NADH-ubiquinone oxidoreductase chain 2 n=1 Tax=Coptotermes testaceus TaxID=280681 RepID=A0A0U2QUB5_9NEOP|nr:NADH dehydrogenase subunit 2 [Coptotermes testaceus]ALP29877.1 NADH dehydrogenase subunit 2 [Coptotermes testaceus]AMX22835.1 NADH dehydrogenase subunit 2 [Coptotermes testaceus]AMX22848.1 NADH dehydrogenase subunit 2 [Coptotermes testaceus]URH16736.1 NADH dehydrogenase subunit 2 [Coptotermes testaceus]WHM51693.1 NADH dehydrogenase subunit 2 [Coptotermes testaceus]